MIQVLELEKYNHTKIQYASSKVPLELWLEGRLRQSTICPQVYVWIEAKERITNNNDVRNIPGEYTLNDTGVGTGKIRPHEDSIRLLEGPTRNMAGKSAQTVNNMPAGVFMDQGKGADHRQQKRR